MFHIIMYFICSWPPVRSLSNETWISPIRNPAFIYTCKKGSSVTWFVFCIMHSIAWYCIEFSFVFFIIWFIGFVLWQHRCEDFLPWSIQSNFFDTGIVWKSSTCTSSAVNIGRFNNSYICSSTRPWLCHF